VALILDDPSRRNIGSTIRDTTTLNEYMIEISTLHRTREDPAALKDPSNNFDSESGKIFPLVTSPPHVRSAPMKSNRCSDCQGLWTLSDGWTNDGFGNGICSKCSGKKRDGSQACASCRGTGRCRTCGGVGQVGAPLASRTASTPTTSPS